MESWDFGLSEKAGFGRLAGEPFEWVNALIMCKYYRGRAGQETSRKKHLSVRGAGSRTTLLPYPPK